MDEKCKHCGHTRRQHEYSSPELCDVKTREKPLRFCSCPGFDPIEVTDAK